MFHLLPHASRVVHVNDPHVREEELMLETILWIFSSFLRMLDLTVQILSCCSLMSCSRPSSWAFRGSNVPSVILDDRNVDRNRGRLGMQAFISHY